MATSLRTSLHLVLSGVWADEVGSSTVGATLNALLQPGTLINQCDVVHSKQYSIVSGTPRVLNLSDGTLLTPNNSPAVFAKVCLALAWNRDDPANTTHLLSWGGGTAPVSWKPNAELVGGPGAIGFKFDPSLAALAVTPTTADRLTLTNAAGTAPITVFLAGRSV
jgi:hypothetical protein